MRRKFLGMSVGVGSMGFINGAVLSWLSLMIVGTLVTWLQGCVGGGN